MNWTADETFYETFEFYVEGVLLMLVAVLGILGNIFFVLVFSCHAKRINTFHSLMVCMAYFDTLYLASSVAIFAVPLVRPPLAHTFLFTHLITILLPTAHIGINGSILLTICLALERYVTVCHPYFKMRHMWSAKYYVVPVVIISFCYNCTRFLELEVWSYPVTEVLEEDLDFLNGTIDMMNLSYTGSGSSFPNISINNNNNNNSTAGAATADVMMVYQLKPTNLRLNEAYVTYYIMWSNLLLFGVLPYLLLIFFNLSTYLKLKTIQKEEISEHATASMVHQRSKEIKLSQIGLMIVLVFICCHSFKWIPNIYELRQSGKSEEEFEWPPWIQCVSNLSSLLTTISSTINVYIYFFKHRNFVLGLVFPPNTTITITEYSRTSRRRSSWMLHTVSSVPENNNTLRLLSSASNRAVEVFL